MNEPAFKNLLHRLQQAVASTAPASSASPQQFTAAVWQRVQRRRIIRRRLAAGSLAACITLLALAAYFANVNPNTAPAPKTPAVAITAETPLQELQNLQDFHDKIAREEQILNDLLSSERAAQTNHAIRRARLAAMPLDPLAEHSDQTAGTFIKHALIMEENSASRPVAAQAYRQIIEHFPDSAWAQLARQQLAQF